MSQPHAGGPDASSSPPPDQPAPAQTPRIPADHPAATRPLSSPAVQTGPQNASYYQPTGGWAPPTGQPAWAPPTGQPWGPSGPATWQSAPPPFPPSGPYQPPRRRNRTGVWAGLAVLLVVLGLLAWQVTGFGARDMRSGYVPRAQVPRSETQEIPTYSSAVTAELSAGIVLVTGDVDNGVSSGTGIILSESGLVLTNYHVVSGTTDLTVRIADTGHAYDADLLGRNVWADIAVLQLEGAGGLTEANIAADPVAVGDRVVAVGNGDGGGVLLASGGSVTELDATVMLESAFGSYGYEDADGMIRSTAGAIPGYSGGPTYNAATEVVGVTSAGQDAVAAQMSTYSIPIAKAAAIADDIAAGRQSEQTRIGPGAWLGVSLGTRNVAVLTAVYPNSPAAAAGLTPGSTITSFDGQPISSASGLLKVVESYDPDDVVDVAWQDDQGEPREASIVLGTSPTN